MHPSSPHQDIAGPARDGTNLNDSYVPVSCDFTDQLEDLSVKKVWLEVAHWGDRGRLVASHGRIVDLVTTPDKAEMLKLDNGTLIRLDRIFEVRPRFRERRTA